MDTIKLELEGDMMPTVERVVHTMQRGGTVVFPTDTLYALGCNGLDPHASAKVFDIKHRSYVRAIPLLVRDISWAKELAYISPEHEALIARFWPGKVTFVLPRRPLVPSIVCGGGQTVGLRAPEYPFLQMLLRHFGYPIAGTSAVVSANQPSADAGLIAATLATTAPQPELIVDAGVLPHSEPSTVVDLSSRRPRIIRQGAVRADLLAPYL
jgi:L-threonylcarbamoyladenylate synthase